MMWAADSADFVADHNLTILTVKERKDHKDETAIILCDLCVLLRQSQT
jgi:hypothetical protein